MYYAVLDDAMKSCSNKQQFIFGLNEKQQESFILHTLENIPFVLKNIHEDEDENNIWIAFVYPCKSSESQTINTYQSTHTVEHSTYFVCSMCSNSEIIHTTERCVVSKIMPVKEFYETNFLDIDKILSKHGMMIRFINPAKQTNTLCVAAISSSKGKAFQYVRADLKTPTMCMMAVTIDNENIQYVPEIHKSPEMCITSLKTTLTYTYEYHLRYGITSNSLTEDVCWASIRSKPESIVTLIELHKATNDMIAYAILEKPILKHNKIIMNQL